MSASEKRPFMCLMLKHTFWYGALRGIESKDHNRIHIFWADIACRHLIFCPYVFIRPFISVPCRMLVRYFLVDADVGSGCCANSFVVCNFLTTGTDKAEST
jgi:hypothetical protein